MHTQTTLPIESSYNFDSIRGDLSTWPLFDLLQWLHNTGRNAMVRIGKGLDGGVLFILNGYLFRVEYANKTGEEALLQLLQLSSAPFSLIQRDVPRPQPNIFLPTEQLLLQLSISIDEARRGQTAS